MSPKDFKSEAFNSVLALLKRRCALALGPRVDIAVPIKGFWGRSTSTCLPSREKCYRSTDRHFLQTSCANRTMHTLSLSPLGYSARSPPSPRGPSAADSKSWFLREGRYWPKGQTPLWAKCTGNLAPRTSTWKSHSSRGRSGRWERQMKSAKRGSKRDQTLRRMTHGWDDAHQHLEPMSCETYHHECARTREKGDV